ncbi:hypothetical protein [Devosia sp. CAU 1758]
MTALERAFALANSGRFHSVTDIRSALKAEGYSLEQITGGALLKQLRQAMERSAQQ